MLDIHHEEERLFYIQATETNAERILKRMGGLDILYTETNLYWRSTVNFVMRRLLSFRDR